MKSDVCNNLLHVTSRKTIRDYSNAKECTQENALVWSKVIEEVGCEEIGN